MEGVVLRRDVPPGRYPLRRLVEGLDASPPLHRLFGSEDACRDALDKAVVELADEGGYMWVSDEDGTLFAAHAYWSKGEALHLYLDLVHELVHVKQFHEGRDLFDSRYTYVERPTELEAYRVVVEEARRLGMDDDALFEFLFVEWCSDDDHRKLCEAVGVPVPAGRKATRTEYWRGD